MFYNFKDDFSKPTPYDSVQKVEAKSKSDAEHVFLKTKINCWPSEIIIKNVLTQNQYDYHLSRIPVAQ